MNRRTFMAAVGAALAAAGLPAVAEADDSWRRAAEKIVDDEWRRAHKLISVVMQDGRYTRYVGDELEVRIVYPARGGTRYGVVRLPPKKRLADFRSELRGLFEVAAEDMSASRHRWEKFTVDVGPQTVSMYEPGAVWYFPRAECVGTVIAVDRQKGVVTAAWNADSVYTESEAMLNGLIAVRA